MDAPYREGFASAQTELARMAAEIARLHADNRRWSKVADERSKENCALRQLLRDARNHVPWDVLKRIDAALGVSRAEQEADEKH